MPRDEGRRPPSSVLPVDAAISKQMRDPQEFKDEVITTLIGEGHSMPDAISLAGLYFGGGDEMIHIDEYEGRPLGGSFGFGGGRHPTAKIGTSMDPGIVEHEIGGHAGLRGLRRQGELDFVPPGSTGRRLADAMPGTFSNQQFLTDEEVKAELGLQPWEPLPFERSAAFSEQAPTAADWFDIQQRTPPEHYAEAGLHRTGLDPILGQNPFVDEHGTIDAMVSELEGDSPHIYTHGARMGVYGQGTFDEELGRQETQVEKIIERLNRLRREGRKTTLWGGVEFDPDRVTPGPKGTPYWTDRRIEDFAIESYIRMAPEREFYGSGLSGDVISSIQEQVGGSEPHRQREEYFKRDLGL